MGSFAIEKAPSPLPALYVTLPESDLDDEVEEVIFCFDVTDSVVVMDTLQNSSALIVAKMKNSEELLVNGRPLPKKILAFLHSLSDEDIVD